MFLRSPRPDLLETRDNFGIVASSLGDNNLKSNLLSYWDLTPASSYNDLTNNGSNLTLINSPSGDNTNGVLLNGTNQYLSVASNSYLQFTSSDFTIAGWINPTSLAANGSYNFIVCQDNIGVGRNWGVIYDPTTADTKLNFQIFNSSGSAFSVKSNFQPTINNWYFLVATHSTSAKKITFIVFEGSTTTPVYAGVVTYTGTLATNSLLTTFGCVLISGSPNFYFNGRLKQWGIWSRTLTGSDILQLHNSGNGLFFSSLD